MTLTWQTQTPGEQAKAWRTQDLSDLEVLHATYISHSFPRHVHEEFCIGIVIHGAEQIHYRGTTHLAPAGSVVVLQPGEVHSNCAATDLGWTYTVLYPNEELMQQASADDRPMPFFANPVLSDPALFQQMLHLQTLLEQPAVFSKLEQQTRLLLTLRQLIQHHASSRRPVSQSGQENRAVQLIKDYLETHYAQNPSLEDLTRLTGLSPYYLTRIFRQTVGLPPHTYLTQVRINRAKTLLAQGETIAQIAADTGFTDQSHLTKTFKAIVGITPGQYRAGVGRKGGMDHG